jgi:tetratricopeptide (TPR) repeat protein
VGLSDVLGKCLADEPRDRYPSAAALADDLRRHLADLPLCGVVNRSFRERWRKWRRRQPPIPTLWILLLVILVAVGLALAYVRHEAHKARAALDAGRQLLQRRDGGAARTALRQGLATAENLPFQGDLIEDLRAQLAVAERAEAAQELHLLVDRLGACYGVDGYPAAHLRAVEAHCRPFWRKRDRIALQLGVQPGPESEQVQHDLLDLAILWTDLRVRLAGKDEARAARQEALEVLAQAEALFGRSCVLECERQAQAAALGPGGPQPRPAPPPRTAWEHYALGRARLRAGDLPSAAAHLDRALALNPQAVGAHFLKGKCEYQRARYEDAVLAFTACVVLAPRSGWCFYNRGLAFEGLGQADRALQDYDRALELDPALAPAAVNRGVLHGRAGRYAEAFADLRRALDHGAEPAPVYYDRALLRLAQGDRSAARADLRAALEHDPRHEPAHRLLESLRPQP